MEHVPNPMLAKWQRTSRLPFGRFLFSALLSRMIPYTGTVRPRVRELRAGYARIELRDRRRVRNHLRSIHAIALANLAEVTSGLAMHCGLPADTRGIVTSFSIDYVKKARGLLTSTCECDPPATNEERELAVESVIRDAAGDVVARGVAQWKIGPSR